MRKGALIAVCVLSMTFICAGHGWAKGPGKHGKHAVSVVVKNFPDVQATATASQPFTLSGLAEFESGDFLVTVDSFSVPPGMVLVLDAASADLQGATTNVDLMAQVRLFLTIPGEPAPVSIATDMKTVTIDLQGGGFIGTPVSWALPPMHLPADTLVSVSVVQNSTVYSLDYRVVVTGHLVPAVASE